jgi:hypothetical protein
MKLIMFANRPPEYFRYNHNNKLIKVLSSDRFEVYLVNKRIKDADGFFTSCKKCVVPKSVDEYIERYP